MATVGETLFGIDFLTLQTFYMHKRLHNKIKERQNPQKQMTSFFYNINPALCSYFKTFYYEAEKSGNGGFSAITWKGLHTKAEDSDAQLKTTQ